MFGSLVARVCKCEHVIQLENHHDHELLCERELHSGRAERFVRKDVECVEGTAIDLQNNNPTATEIIHIYGQQLPSTKCTQIHRK